MKDHAIEQCTPKCFKGQPALTVPAKPRKVGKRELHRTKVGYMCATDYLWHLENSCKGANVYPTQVQLRALRPCSEQCGTIRVRVTWDKTISKPSHGR